jgi:hypothetical protein
VSLSWLKKPLRVGIGAKSIVATGGRSLELPAAEGWRGTVSVLAEVLKPHKGREAGVVLADQFVRYALLPWSAAVRTPEQWLALARHRFAALHGAAAAEWDVKVAETAPSGPRLACAVDRELVEALSAAFAGAGVGLASVQPFLVAAFNRIRGRIGAGSYWIVVEEPGRLTLALIQRGAWVAIRTRRSDARWRLVLPEILERESAFLGLDEPCMRVIVCAQGEFDTQLHAEWRTDAISYSDLALARE